DHDHASTECLRLVESVTGSTREVARQLDRWPMSPVWSADGSAVFFTAHDDGADSVYRLDVRGERLTRLATGSAFTDLCPSSDGSVVYALRSHIDRPPHIVRLDVALEREPARRARLRGAHAGPGDLPGLRTGVRRPWLGPLGRSTVHGRDRRRRRRSGAAGDRRVADRADGRLVRRLHGEL